MMWYLLKTWAGKEEELAEEIRRTVPPGMYGECFVIRQERIWRKQQRSIVHVEPLFPGCVFLTCKTRNYLETKTFPFQFLRQIPSMAEWTSWKDLAILPMIKEDAEFLEKISGKDHLVRLSYVMKNEQGKICKISNPLSIFQGEIECYQFKKRYAMVRHKLWGEERAIVLGIMLKEDWEQKSLPCEDGRCKKSFLIQG